MQGDAENSRSLAAIIADMKVELREFTETRFELLKTELQEKTKAVKLAAPLAGLAGLLLVTAYLLFTAALVGLVLAFFDHAHIDGSSLLESSQCFGPFSEV